MRPLFRLTQIYWGSIKIMRCSSSVNHFNFIIYKKNLVYFGIKKYEKGLVTWLHKRISKYHLHRPRYNLRNHSEEKLLDTMPKIEIFNRYRRKRPKVDASIFDSALSHTRRSDASEKKSENSVSTFERFRLCTSFESSPVSVERTNSKKLNIQNIKI